jgi:predicted nucleic acid-binding protein
MSFLADTNVLSELARPKPDAGVRHWARGLTTISVSALTIEEIAFGLAWRPSARIRKWFDDFVDAQCDVLPVTYEIALCAGELRGKLQAGGNTRTQTDMLIAATAVVEGLMLVTRNARDFKGCGVSVLDPFSGSA